MPVAIVTGSSRGLGRAVAEALGRDGWSLVLDARREDALRAAASAIGVRPDVVAVPGDVTDPAHRQALVREAVRLGGLDLLVNNAGILGPSPQPPLADYPLDVFEDVHRVNVVAPLALVQVALPLLAASAGAVVNVTSDAAVEAYAGWGGYGAAKAGLEQVSAVLAVERPDVRVYVFDPGDLRTQMHQEAFPGEDISDRAEPATVVPALLRLVREAPPSGRYRAADLLAAVR